MPTLRLLATDRLLSPILIAGMADWSPIAYTVTGQRSAPSAAAVTGFTGQMREHDLDRYLLGNGHRLYNPALMRFHSPDRRSPFDEGGVNSYAYCGGDPVNRHDRNGRYSHAVFSGDLLNFTALITSGILGFASKYLNQKFSRASIASLTLTVAGASSYGVGRVMEGMELDHSVGFQIVGNYMMVAGTIVGASDVVRSMRGTHRALSPSVSRERSLNSEKVSSPVQKVHAGASVVTNPPDFDRRSYGQQTSVTSSVSNGSYERQAAIEESVAQVRDNASQLTQLI